MLGKVNLQVEKQSNMFLVGKLSQGGILQSEILKRPAIFIWRM